MIRSLAAALAALALVACGGGGGDAAIAAAGPAPVSIPAMPAAMRAALEQAIPVRKAIVAGGPLTATEALDWAETAYPELFNAAGRQQGFATPYTYRYYPASNSYLGVATASGDVAVY